MQCPSLRTPDALTAAQGYPAMQHVTPGGFTRRQRQRGMGEQVACRDYLMGNRPQCNPARCALWAP